MHIVHIIPTLRFGGAERFVVDLSNGLVEKGHDVSIITLFDERQMQDQLTAGIAVHVVQKKSKFGFGLVAELKNMLKELQPNLVHTHLFGADVWGRKAAYALKIPVVTTEHNTNVDESWLKHLVKRVFRYQSAVFTCYSQAVYDYLQKKYGVNKKKIVRINQGINVKRYKDVPPVNMDETLYLLALGRFEHQKGFDILLDALDRLKQYNWILHMRGEGSLKFRLMAHTKCLKQHDCVAFYKPTPDVPAVFGEVDVVVMPSRWEGLGLIAKEAMAAGRLVVASNVGGLPESVKHKKTGLLVEPHSVEALVEQLEWLLTHKKEAKALAAAAKKYAQKEFGFEKTINAYENLYHVTYNL